jgi:prophage antirepressor-like protein
MDIIRQFEIENKTLPVRILGTEDAPLFLANEIGKMLEIKNIHMTLRKFDEDEKCDIELPTNSGRQTFTALTELGLIKMFGITRSKIGKQFRVWVLNVIRELRTSGYVTLEQVNRMALSYNDEIIQRSNSLVKNFAGKNVFYLIKVGDLGDDKVVYKIGQTNGEVASRLSAHTRNYKELQPKEGRATLVDAWECENPKEMESQIKGILFPTHKFSFKNSATGMGAEELVLVDNKELTVAKLLDMINSKVATEQDKKNKTAKLKAKIEALMQVIALFTKENDIKEEINRLASAIEKQNELMTTPPAAPTPPVQEIVVKEQIVLIHGRRHKNKMPEKKIQKIDPVTLKVVAVYDDDGHVLQHNFDITRSMISKAIEGGKISYGYYWKYTEPDQTDPFQVVNVDHFKTTFKSIQQPVARLDKDKTKILAVFENVSELVLDDQFSDVCRGWVFQLVRKDKPYGNFCYVKWMSLDDHLKRAWIIENNGVAYTKMLKWTVFVHKASGQETAHRGDPETVSRRVRGFSGVVSCKDPDNSDYDFTFREEMRPTPISEDEVKNFIVYK